MLEENYTLIPDFIKNPIFLDNKDLDNKDLDNKDLDNKDLSDDYIKLLNSYKQNESDNDLENDLEQTLSNIVKQLENIKIEKENINNLKKLLANFAKKEATTEAEKEAGAGEAEAGAAAAERATKEAAPPPSPSPPATAPAAVAVATGTSAENIASNLNNLFESELFQINYYLDIYKLLGIYTNVNNLLEQQKEAPTPPPAPLPAPPAPPAPPAAPTAPLPIVIARIKDNLKISGGCFNSEILVNDFYNESTLDKNFLTNISNTIKNSDILADYEGNIIIDPANINSISKSNGLNYSNNGGLSKQIYIKLDKSTITYTNYTEIDRKYSKEETKLFTSPDDVNAFYDEYIIKSNKQIKIIHVVGPNFSGKNQDYLDKYLTYTTFNKIYNDITKVYLEKKNDSAKLLLVPISSGLFAKLKCNDIDNITKEILTITAAIFIKLYLLHENLIEMYIWDSNGNQTDYNFFKEQIKKILDYL